MKKKCIFDNVHFMHLECNTLQSTKEYIPGCQCDFCIQENLETINMHSHKVINNFHHFLEQVHCYDIIPNFWNVFLQVFITNDNITTLKIYNPFIGSRYEKLLPIHFVNDIIDYIN